MTDRQHPVVTTHLHGPVAVVQFAHPPHHTIDVSGALKLTEAIQAALEDSEVRAIILTGTDGTFIRHADVSQIKRAADAIGRGQITGDSFVGAPFHHLGNLIEQADKPVIAAINGTCMGGGLELALACHLRIAQQDMQVIGLPEIRLGIMPGSGGMERLANLIGPHKARAFVLDARTYDAQAALDLGLVDAVATDALSDAIGKGNEWARYSPQSVSAVLGIYRPPLRHSDASVRAFADLLVDARPQLAAFCDGKLRLEELP